MDTLQLPLANPLPEAPAILKRNWRMARRSFLKGAGAMLGLPLLDAMGTLQTLAAPDAPASTKAASHVQAPVRMACIYFPNGVYVKNWFPQNAGTDFELPFSLEPLANHRDNVLIFSGLDKQNSHQGDGHYAKTANFLTGLPCEKLLARTLAWEDFPSTSFARRVSGT